MIKIIISVLLFILNGSKTVGIWPIKTQVEILWKIFKTLFTLRLLKKGWNWFLQRNVSPKIFLP